MLKKQEVCVLIVMMTVDFYNTVIKKYLVFWLSCFLKCNAGEFLSLYPLLFAHFNGESPIWIAFKINKLFNLFKGQSQRKHSIARIIVQYFLCGCK